jgi:hypothetical protein
VLVWTVLHSTYVRYVERALRELAIGSVLVGPLQGKELQQDLFMVS